MCECVSSFLTAHQHILGYLVPYNDVEDTEQNCLVIRRYLYWNPGHLLIVFAVTQGTTVGPQFWFLTHLAVLIVELIKTTRTKTARLDCYINILAAVEFTGMTFTFLK